MKKIIGLSVILCMLAALLSLNAFAAPTLLWEFGEGSDIEGSMGINSPANALTYEAESFYYVFTATGVDPYVSIDLSVDDVSKVQWVKARVLNKSAATAIELFGATNGRSLSGPECTHIDIQPNLDQWQTVITYIPDANVATVNAYKAVDPLTETYWEGTVDWIRLDPMWIEGEDGTDNGGATKDGDQIYIDYIAFFATEDEAKAYVGPDEQAEAADTAAETAAPADTTAPADTAADAEAPAAAQTSDIASVAVIAAVLALGAAYIVSKKK